MCNTENKTALNTSWEQFREHKLGVYTSWLLGVYKESKCPQCSWAGSHLKMINSKHQAQTLSHLLATQTAAVPLPIILHGCLLSRHHCWANECPESGLPAARKNFCLSSPICGGYPGIRRCFPLMLGTYRPALDHKKTGNIGLEQGEWQLETLWLLPLWWFYPAIQLNSTTAALFLSSKGKEEKILWKGLKGWGKDKEITQQLLS